MTIGGWAQLALGLVQLLNWITSKIDQQDWKNAGWMEAYQDYLSKVNSQVQDMKKIAAKNEKLTDEELNNSL